MNLSLLKNQDIQINIIYGKNIVLPTKTTKTILNQKTLSID